MIKIILAVMVFSSFARANMPTDLTSVTFGLFGPQTNDGLPDQKNSVGTTCPLKNSGNPGLGAEGALTTAGLGEGSLPLEQGTGTGNQ